MDSIFRNWVLKDFNVVRNSHHLCNPYLGVNGDWLLDLVYFIKQSKSITPFYPYHPDSY